MIEVLGRVGAQRVRRLDARQADVEKLAGEVKKFFKFRGFNWQERYNLKYILQYAREKGWNASRLNKAIETLDLRYRQTVNHKLWENRVAERVRVS